MDLDVAGRSGPRLGGPRKDGVGEGFAPDAVPVSESDELDDLGCSGRSASVLARCAPKTLPQVGGGGAGRAVQTPPAPALPEPGPSVPRSCLPHATPLAVQTSCTSMVARSTALPACPFSSSFRAASHRSSAACCALASYGSAPPAGGAAAALRLGGASNRVAVVRAF